MDADVKTRNTTFDNDDLYSTSITLALVIQRQCHTITTDHTKHKDDRRKTVYCGHACASGRVDEAVSGGKPPAGKGVVGMLS